MIGGGDPFTCGRRHDFDAFGMSSCGEENADHWQSEETCSYCGSISPRALFAAIDTGTVLGPTDKNYKVYVGSRNKFYFQHFSAEDRAFFIELYNRRLLNIGYPGFFYVMPFFCSTTPPEATCG